MGNSLLKGLSVLAGIAILILLAGAGKMTWPVAQMGLPIASYGDSLKMVEMGVIDMKARICRLMTPEEVFQRIAKFPKNPGIELPEGRITWWKLTM